MDGVCAVQDVVQVCFKCAGDACSAQVTRSLQVAERLRKFATGSPVYELREVPNKCSRNRNRRHSYLTCSQTEELIFCRPPRGGCRLLSTRVLRVGSRQRLPPSRSREPLSNAPGKNSSLAADDAAHLQILAQLFASGCGTLCCTSAECGRFGKYCACSARTQFCASKGSAACFTSGTGHHGGYPTAGGLPTGCGDARIPSTHGRIHGSDVCCT